MRPPPSVASSVLSTFLLYNNCGQLRKHPRCSPSPLNPNCIAGETETAGKPRQSRERKRKNEKAEIVQKCSRNHFPGVGGKLLYWVLILGAIAGLFTTWNGFFTPSANLLMSMGRGKLVFPFFARQNSGGVAVYGQLFVLILSCCGPFLGPNLIDSITSFSGAAFILSWMITAWSLVMCRVRYPDKKRPYRIPGGIATGIFAGTVSSAAFIFMFVPSSPFYIGATAVKMFFGWLAVGLLFYLASFPQRRKLTNEELEMGVFGSALSDAEKEG